jgi:pimeloyl-ACP methyl ester carboxylesterase
MSLAHPPKKLRRTSRPLGLVRMLMLTVVLLFFGVFAWGFLVTARIAQVETVDRTVIPPGRMVDVPTVTQFHLRDLGSGGSRPLLMIHDFDLAGGRQWLAVAEGLEGRRLLIPDLTGFGYSPRATEPERLLTVIGQAEALGGLLDQLGVGAVDVVGAGRGGAVAAQLAALRPVGHLVLIAPEIYGPRPPWYQGVVNVPVLGRAYLFTSYGATGTGHGRYQNGCLTGGWCPDATAMADWNHAVRVVGTTDSLSAIFRTPPATTLPAALSDIGAPTLVIWGSADSVTPPADGGLITAAIDGSSMEALTEVGHRPQLEAPAEVAARIAAFLETTPG